MRQLDIDDVASPSGLADAPTLAYRRRPVSLAKVAASAATQMSAFKNGRRLTVSLVIPAKNEARNLATVLANIPSCVDELILVDGQSSDVTQMMARSCRPDIHIIDEPAPGKGHALRAGFAAASEDLIIAIDADGSMDPQEIPQMVYFLEHGFDFVKGSRFVAGGGSLDITALRRLGNRGLMLLANRLYRMQMTDLCYGFFGFHRKYLAHLNLRSEGFEIETEITVRAAQAGLRIAELPSLEMPRRSGRSNLNSVSDGLRVLKTMLEERKVPVKKAHPGGVDADMSDEAKSPGPGVRYSIVSPDGR